MDKRIIIEEAESDGCCGFKNPDECPHEGVFNSESDACKECEQDMLDAMSETYKE